MSVVVAEHGNAHSVELAPQAVPFDSNVNEVGHANHDKALWAVHKALRESLDAGVDGCREIASSASDPDYSAPRITPSNRERRPSAPWSRRELVVRGLLS